MGGWLILGCFALIVVALIVYARHRAPTLPPRPFEGGDGGSMIGSGESTFTETGGRVRGTGDSAS
jgi:hypothetical protein